MKTVPGLSAVAMTALFVGCSDLDSSRTIEIAGVTYTIPAEHITALVEPPDGRHYVRLHPPSANFHLVFDEISHYRVRNRQGDDVPTISRLNDNRFEEFDVIREPHGIIVCLQGPRPHFNCGMRVMDGDVRWGVLFDRTSLSRAQEVRIQAERLIGSYRSAP